jgi:hypothetical protein
MPNTVLNSFIPNHTVIDIFPGLAAFPEFMQNSRKTQYLQGDVSRAERKRDQAHLTALSHERSHRARMAA